MKKIIKTVILVLILTFAVSFKSVSVYAWDDCPKGEVNDPYPGECARYIDTDQNGICDHSEPAPEDRVNQAPVILESQIEKGNDLTNSEPNLKKFLTIVGIVGFHLTAILMYVSFKKNKFAKT